MYLYSLIILGSNLRDYIGIYITNKNIKYNVFLIILFPLNIVINFYCFNFLNTFLNISGNVNRTINCVLIRLFSKRKEWKQKIYWST